MVKKEAKILKLNSLYNPNYHIKIPALPKEVHRPLWSVVIPSYNCAKYLKQTLKSVLVQDLGEAIMEIIVVDDHSTKDNPELIVKEFGQGRVKFYRQSKNVGKSSNYALGIIKSKGKYIHLLHGDDTVNQGFYKAITDLFKEYPKASAAFCRCNYVNAQSNKIGETELLLSKSGIINNFLERIAVWQLIQPPSIVFKREVYETLGGFDNRLEYIEDWEFYVRAALNYKFIYSPDSLANYRVFPENSSSKSIKGGKRVKTIEQVLSIMDGYLPYKTKKKICKRRRGAVSIYLLNYIPNVISNRDLKGFFKFSKAFFKFNSNPRLLFRWIRFIIQHTQ